MQRTFARHGTVRGHHTESATSLPFDGLLTLASRMGKGARGDAPRVLCVTGSESGSTHNQMKRVIKDWEAKSKGGFSAEIKNGNEVMSSFSQLQEISSKFDVILVATSSYGEGEPPDNITSFFTALMKAANAGEKPLQGLQHAVLGFGSSVYDTYQNCPRLMDRYLGEAGSRRMSQRAELDEAHDTDKEEEQPDYARWTKEVFQALHALPSAESPPACAWTKPKDKVLLISSDGASSGNGTLLMGLLVMGVAAAVGYQFLLAE